MKHVPIKLGPLALLLAVISICLTVLAILSFATARADLALAKQYAETVRTRYALEQEGQQWLASAGPNAERTFEQDDMCLTVELDKNGQVKSWTYEKQWIQENGISGLWTGD